MFRLLLCLFFVFQSAMVSSQTLEYLNFMEKPVLDTSKYRYEYLKITTAKNGVVYTQLINRDTIKIAHTTSLLDGDGAIQGERILRYDLNGTIESSKRIDHTKAASEIKYFYPSGELKSEISYRNDKIESEVYYSETGEKIAKPIIEEPAPKGGIKGWTAYLGKTLRYPSEARAVGAEGTVFLEFDLDEQGMIHEIRVGNPEFVHEALWEEAVRVIRAYPYPWSPKIEDGKAISTFVRLPIRFKLG